MAAATEKKSKGFFAWLMSRLYRKMILSFFGVIVFLIVSSVVLYGILYGYQINRLFRERFQSQTAISFQMLEEKLKEAQSSDTKKVMRRYLLEATALLGARIVVQDRQGRCLMEAYPPFQAWVGPLISRKLRTKRLVEDLRGRCLKDRYPRQARRLRWLLTINHRLLQPGGSEMKLIFQWLPPVWIVRTPYFSLVFLLIIVGAGLLVSLLSRTITKPLRELTQAVQAIQTGDLQRSVASSGRDEVSELARSIEEMRLSLLRLGEQKNILIADLSHEIRTPLARIRTVAESVADGLMREETKLTRAMEGICLQVDEVGQLLGDMMDLVRWDLPGEQRLSLEETEPEAFLSEIHARFEAGAAAQNKRLLCSELPPDLPTIALDPKRMRQVFSNLIQNAVRYSPAGGAITLGAAVEEGFLRFSVCDQGPGIPVADRERIFERLVRLDPSRSRQTGGQGLGLAIVKQIMKAHNGEVGVTEAPGGGSCFWLRLPLTPLVKEKEAREG